MKEQVERWLMKTTKPDKQVRLLLSKYWEKIDQLYSPDALWLFGSRASDEASSDSDIDLVVVSQRFADIRRLKRRSTFLRETGLASDTSLPVIDPLCYTPDEFELGLRQPTIVAEVTSTGIQLIAGSNRSRTGQFFVAESDVQALDSKNEE